MIRNVDTVSAFILRENGTRKSKGVNTRIFCPGQEIARHKNLPRGPL